MTRESPANTMFTTKKPHCVLLNRSYIIIACFNVIPLLNSKFLILSASHYVPTDHDNKTV